MQYIIMVINFYTDFRLLITFIYAIVSSFFLQEYTKIKNIEMITIDTLVRIIFFFIKWDIN